MPSCQPEETAQQELRMELICDLTTAIGVVREKVSKLNDREKEYMERNSVTYRQLVETIRSWSSSR